MKSYAAVTIAFRRETTLGPARDGQPYVWGMAKSARVAPDSHHPAGRSKFLLAGQLRPVAEMALSSSLRTPLRYHHSLAQFDSRSVLYHGRLAEVFVPYQDPDQNWFIASTWMKASSVPEHFPRPLARGLDVPENSVLLNATISAATPYEHRELYLPGM